MKEQDHTTDFRRFYEENFSRLVQFARQFTSKETAKDIVQDTFMDLWERGQVRYNDASGRSYLFMCVRNRCLNLLKQEQVKEQYLQNTQIDNRLLGLDYYDSAEKQFIDDENLHQIYRQIDLLPDKCREIFKLAYYEDKKSKEIAELLHLSIRTVEHQLYLGLKILREKLKAEKSSSRKNSGPKP